MSGDQRLDLPPQIIRDQLLHEASVPNHDRRRTERFSDSFLTPEEFEERRPTLTAALDAYYAMPPRKDSWPNRIRHSIDLLIESDRQERDAVAAALNFAAIDALLGEDNLGGIGHQLVTFVARLLEPEPERRLAAEQTVRQLYDLRNSVFHTGDFEATAQERNRSRLLAGGVLGSILNHVGTVQRINEEDEKPSKLFDELRKQRYVAGEITGVLETAARKLWT